MSEQKWMKVSTFKFAKRQLSGEIYLGGKAKRFTVVYNDKRRYATVKRARYHSIPRGILPFHTQYRLNSARDCRSNSKLAV